MDRLTAWTGELMFWVGGRLNRLERWPKPYYSVLFLLSWLSLSLLAHYAGLDAGMSRRYLSWAGAVAMGFLLSCIASLVVYLTYLRRPG